MIPSWRDRLRAAVCRLLGHREDDDTYVVVCRRCRLLLRRSPRRAAR